MGVRIFVGREAGSDFGERAILFCSTSQWAFGPIFDSYDDAETFLEALPVDARSLTDNKLERRFSAFLLAKEVA